METIRRGRPAKKPVHQYDVHTQELIASYPSIYQATKETGVASGNILQACNKDVYYAGDFFWSYKPDDSFPEYRPRYKKVYKYDINTCELLESFDTVKEAAYASHCNPSNITQCCKKNPKHRMAAGYYWSNDPNDKFEPYEKHGRYKGKILKLCPKTHEIIDVYNSRKEASELTGIGQSCISSTIVGRRRTAGGFVWCTLEEYDFKIN